MKDPINKENYEAFYLDYLEGNLDEDATLALFAFLASHPALQVEDLGPIVMDSLVNLDADFKNNLKQDLSSVSITAQNIEYFLTAEKENQLSKSKLDELEAFITAQPKYQVDRKIYGLSTVIADKSMIFNDKKALKQRGPIVLWPYLSAMAAACAILVIWLIPEAKFTGEIQSAANVPTILKKKTSHQGSGQNAVNSNQVQHLGHSAFVHNNENERISPSTTFKKDISGRLAFRSVQRFEETQAKNWVLETLTEYPTSAIAYQPTPVPEDAPSSGILALANPVQPITTKISDMINTQIEYKTGENLVSKRKGFYLKIGQLEIYQNKQAKSQ